MSTVQYSQGYVDKILAEHAAEVARLQEKLRALEARLDEEAARATWRETDARTLSLLIQAIRGEVLPADHLPDVVLEAMKLRRDHDGMCARRRRNADRRGRRLCPITPSLSHLSGQTTGLSGKGYSVAAADGCQNFGSIPSS